MKRMIGFSFVLMVAGMSYGMERSMSFLEQTLFVAPPYLLTEPDEDRLSLEDCKRSVRNFWEGCKRWYVARILSLAGNRADSTQENPPTDELYTKYLE